MDTGRQKTKDRLAEIGERIRKGRSPEEQSVIDKKRRQNDKLREEARTLRSELRAVNTELDDAMGKVEASNLIIASQIEEIARLKRKLGAANTLLKASVISLEEIINE